MRIVTFQAADGGSRRPGAVDRGEIVDLSALCSDDPAGSSVLKLLRGGPSELARAREAIDRSRSTGRDRIPMDSVHLLAPLPRPNTIRDFMLVEEHVNNSFGSVPAEWYQLPIHWKGNPDTVFGPDTEIPWPYYTDKLDFELEVAAVLGRPAYQVGVEEAQACIAGFTIFNDWSARDIQLREMKVGLGPAFGKDFATSMGPVLVTPDEFDVRTAAMTARVNGETWTSGNLGGMLFSFAEAISALSATQPLQPGDVFGGGTVENGCGYELDRWVKPGDVVELEVEGIGVLRNTVGHKQSPPSSGLDLRAPTESASAERLDFNHTHSAPAGRRSENQ